MVDAMKDQILGYTVPSKSDTKRSENEQDGKFWKAAVDVRQKSERAG